MMTPTALARDDARSAQWFESWFDSCFYHDLYAHRDDGEAARFVDALVDRLQPGPDAEMLDLGCGSGRHARQLASRGFTVTGLDLSAASIAAARRSAMPGLRFRRHDMRRPFGGRAFDYVFNFFTSFGYFDSAGEHRRVARNMARALRPGGRLVLDYLNAGVAAATLRPFETRATELAVYRLTRWSNATHLFKRIEVEDRRDGRRRAFVERVARFTAADLARLFRPHGVVIEETLGDYDLRPFDAARSPRLILIARKTAGEPAWAGDAYLRDRFLRTRLSVSGVTPRYDASIHCGTRAPIEG